MLVDSFDPCQSASGGSQTAFLALSISVLIFVGMDAASTMYSVFLFARKHQKQVKRVHLSAMSEY